MKFQAVCLQTILFSLLVGGSAVMAESKGVYFSHQRISVRDEAPHHQFRIPSNAYEASLSFCQKRGYSSILGFHHEQIKGQWFVSDLICSHQTEASRSLKQAAKAHIAQDRVSRGQSIQDEDRVLLNYLVGKGMFKRVGPLNNKGPTKVSNHSTKSQFVRR